MYDLSQSFEFHRDDYDVVVPDMDVLWCLHDGFFNSKINLNISLRSIFAGTSLRAFDVMGSGGFLMSNKQKDMDGLLIDGVDYVSFDSLDDLVDKAEYYLYHEHGRIKILVHGYRKVCNYHTYQDK